MNILVLGGKQAYKSEMPDSKSYLAQFARRIRKTGNPVKIDHRPVALAEATQLIPQLQLSDYDLILLQFDLPLDWLPITPVSRLGMRTTLWLRGMRFLLLKDVRRQLAQVLLQVRVCNRQVILITPFPNRRGLEQQLTQLTHTVYVQESLEWQVPLFDVSKQLSCGDEFFRNGSMDQLSTVAHELLGSELHTFITEPTYTLWS
ncbi:hypothetical protein [Fibrella aquatica]|uniref:hypothetical protein n=1 Tax=Fibrella aquatica TaxID=3242487 RepID=UPI00352305E7